MPWGDGIAANSGTKYALLRALEVIDMSAVVDFARSFYGDEAAAVWIMKDLLEYAQGKEYDPRFGGTSTFGAQVLLDMAKDQQRKSFFEQRKHIVLFGAESNVSPVLMEHLKERTQLLQSA